MGMCRRACCQVAPSARLTAEVVSCGFTRAEYHRDGLGVQPAGNKGQRLSRGLVQPLRIADQAQQRLFRGHVRQQAQHRQVDQEAIWRAAGLQPEGDAESVALRTGHAVETMQHPQQSWCSAVYGSSISDSTPAIGGECERAAELYAQACRLGEPDPAELAGWLATFRATSPGWPTLLLADFVDAFDDHAVAIYRAAVADLDRQHAGRDHWSRFEVDAMLLELADHDGDVDRAVDLLNEREHPQYGAIVARLREAGRDDEVVNWIDRAVGEGRASSHGGGSGYWLSPSDVADTYRGIGRNDDAIAVLRTDFVRQPAVHAYRSLLDFAGTIDRADTERAWALDHARALADGPGAGSVLVQLSLSEGDVDAAWEAADRYGPGWAWQELATQGAEARPVAAADLYRPQLENDLQRPNTGLYPGIAATLATMAELYERGGRSADFALYIAKVRQDYGRRPSLMKALQAKGL